jgi:cell wall-associated NlpC family hydrolase
MLLRKTVATDSCFGSSHRKPRRDRRRGSIFEALEGRLLLSSSQTLATGVSSLALGDVNGDQIADIAVAGCEGGNFVVNIYDSRGTSSTSSSTGATVNLIASLVNPLGKGVGPLSIALGDFTGSETSQLAVASSARVPGHRPVVAIYQFQLAAGTFPMGAAVTPVLLTKSFTPAGLGQSTGLQLAASDLDGNGPDELVVGPTGSSAHALDVLNFQTASSKWNVANQFNLKKIHMNNGVFVSAGDLAGNGTSVIVVGSQKHDQVDVLNSASGSVEQSLQPFSQQKLGARVSVDAAVNQPGSIVVTPAGAGSNAVSPVIILATTWASQSFTPVDSPGAGALVSVGAGFVYQRSTIQNLSSSLPTSDGPDTPCVIFGSQNGSSLVVQGFDQVNQTFSPSASDTIVEPTLSQATPGRTFSPLEEPGDLPGPTTFTDYPAIAYPPITYQSPFSINLAGMPSSIYAGLLPTTPVIDTTTDPWGPGNPSTTAPTVPSGQGAAWLEALLLAVYNQAIGVAYQHHHNPFWQPTQGSPWNAATIGYQSQGVDCTDLTSYAYLDALDVYLNSDTAAQASITASNHPSSLITIPQSMTPYLSIQVLAGSAGNTPQDYQSFVSQLQPGDILFINPSKTPGEASDPSACTHAITWLGNFGVDKNGMYQHLIVDSTGNAPVHVDSNNHVIPAGVHVRPFEAPNAVDLNDWYFEHVDHVLRLVLSA